MRSGTVRVSRPEPDRCRSVDFVAGLRGEVVFLDEAAGLVVAAGPLEPDELRLPLVAGLTAGVDGPGARWGRCSL
jgi:hypothetical protein